MAELGKLILFRRPPDYPRWACGHFRKRALHLTNPNAREGSPYERCPKCVADDHARRWRAFCAVLFGFAIGFLLMAMCSAGGGKP